MASKHIARNPLAAMFRRIFSLLFSIASGVLLVAALDTKPDDFRGIRCQDAKGTGRTLLTPTYGHEKPVFSVCGEVVIDASISQVYDAIIGFDKYPQWNTFVVDVKAVNGSLQNVKQYDKFVFKSNVLPLDIPYSDDEIVTVVEKQGDFGLIAWKLDDPPSGLLQRSEHVWILTSTTASGRSRSRRQESQTRVVSYENFFGVLSYPTELLLDKKLQDKFDQQNRELKAYVEGRK